MDGRGSSYREKRRKKVTTPDGDEFIIRKPGAITYTEQFRISDTTIGELTKNAQDQPTIEEIKETIREASSERTPKEMMKSIDSLILECVVSPKIVDHETENNDELWIGDLDPGDYFFLFQEISDYSDMGPEKMHELFRNLGRTDRPTGGVDIQLDESTA